MMCSEMSSESQELSGIFRDTVVRPRLKVVMSNFTFFSVLDCVKKLIYMGQAYNYTYPPRGPAENIAHNG
jgi:hypothetical protein